MRSSAVLWVELTLWRQKCGATPPCGLGVESRFRHASIAHGLAGNGRQALVDQRVQSGEDPSSAKMAGAIFARFVGFGLRGWIVDDKSRCCKELVGKGG